MRKVGSSLPDHGLTIDPIAPTEEERIAFKNLRESMCQSVDLTNEELQMVCDLKTGTFFSIH